MIRVFILLVFFAVGFGYSLTKEHIKDINPRVIYMETTPKVINYEDKAFIIYKDEEGKIILKETFGKNENKIVVSENKKGFFYKNFNYFVKGDTLYVIYWAKKIPFKYVKITAVDMKAFKVLFRSTVSWEEPLGVPVGTYFKGKVFVFWKDESKDKEIKSFYKIYGRVSEDGKTWNKKQIFKIKNLNTDPQVLVFKDNLYLFANGCENKDKCGIFVSKYDDKSGKFSEAKPVILFKEHDINYDGYHVGKLDNHIAVGIYSFGSKDVYNCMSSDGNDFKCSRIDVKELLKAQVPHFKGIGDKYSVDLTFMHAAHSGKNIYYAVTVLGGSAIKSGSFQFPNKKNPYLLVSNDEGKTWKIVNLTDYRPFVNTQYMPFVTADKDTVAVVWIDYRNIIPQPYMSLSKDGGKTWIKDVPLYKPYSVQSDLPTAKLVNDKIYSWYILDPDIVDKEKSFLEIVSLKTDEAKELKAEFPDKFTSEQKEKLLKDTLEKFIQVLKSGDEKNLYDFFDPYFRAYNPFEVWKVSRVKVKFLDAKLLEYAYLKGTNIAKVRFKVKVKKPEMVLGKFKVPEDKRIEERIMKFYWAFIDGKWYQLVPKLDGFFAEW